jgi:hypothetical protein
VSHNHKAFSLSSVNLFSANKTQKVPSLKVLTDKCVILNKIIEFWPYYKKQSLLRNYRMFRNVRPTLLLVLTTSVVVHVWEIAGGVRGADVGVREQTSAFVEQLAIG